MVIGFFYAVILALLCHLRSRILEVGLLEAKGFYLPRAFMTLLCYFLSLARGGHYFNEIISPSLLN
jgi:hypothetical protein